MICVDKVIIASVVYEIDGLRPGVFMYGAKFTACAIALLASPLAHAQLDLPPNAQPGECYTKVVVPAEYVTTVETVMVKPATTKLRTVPATYETIQETVLVQEASFEFVTIPPRYEAQEERVLVRPERIDKRVIPARYETVEERIMVEPARVEWKPGRGALERVDAATGEIMCRVEVPARYETVKKKVLIEPERVEEVPISATYETVEKRVLVEEARVERREIPAKYATREVRRQITPERTVQDTVPAEFETVEHRSKVTDERMAWRQILCETNTTPDVIRSLQNALNALGYDAGVADGVYGRQTALAVEKFQTEAGTPTGGLTIQTLRLLGITL